MIVTHGWQPGLSVQPGNTPDPIRIISPQGLKRLAETLALEQTHQHPDRFLVPGLLGDNQIIPLARQGNKIQSQGQGCLAPGQRDQPTQAAGKGDPDTDAGVVGLEVTEQHLYRQVVAADKPEAAGVDESRAGRRRLVLQIEPAVYRDREGDLSLPGRIIGTDGVQELSFRPVDEDGPSRQGMFYLEPALSYARAAAAVAGHQSLAGQRGIRSVDGSRRTTPADTPITNRTLERRQFQACADALMGASSHRGQEGPLREPIAR